MKDDVDDCAEEIGAYGNSTTLANDVVMPKILYRKMVNSPL